MKLPLLLVGSVLLLIGCGQPKKEETQPEVPPGIPVRLVAVEEASRTEPIQVAGTVASTQEARLSFKVGGIIRSITVKEGQAVRKGQLLASLDLTEINAQVTQAMLASEKAERDFTRVKRMFEDTAATLEQLQNVTTGLEVAQQNVQIARFNKQYAQLVAPLDGMIARKLLNEGELAAPGNPVLFLTSSRPADWVVRVGVSDRDWARLGVNDPATVVLDAYPEEVFRGTVTELAQAADPATKLYEVEVRIVPNGKRLASGLFAKVMLTPSQSRSYHVIPVEALVEGQGREGYVFVVKEGKAYKVPIKIGYLSDDKVLVTQGLDGVEEVVTAGNAYLKEGTAIRVVAP
jgi:RND family efflux transporter MFP subunit